MLLQTNLWHTTWNNVSLNKHISDIYTRIFTRILFFTAQGWSLNNIYMSHFSILTNISHVHGNRLSCHGEQTEDVLLSVVQFKCVSIKCGCLDVILVPNTRHMPSCNLTIAKPQDLATFIYITINCC